MAMIPFAFSVHNFISSVGADAGFAAIIGLAVLVLLYFAHARETANLREEAAMLTERLREAEGRVAELTGAQAAAVPQTAATRTAAVATAMAPFAPAGTGAPALAAATRVVPLVATVPEPAAVGPPAAPPRVAPVPEPPRVAPAPAPQAVPVPEPPVASAAPAMAGAAASPSSSPVAASAESTGHAARVPAPATAAGGNGAGHTPAGPRPVDTGTDWPPTGDRAVGRPLLDDLPPLDGSRQTRRSRFGRGLAVALGALAVVAAAVVLVAVTSLGGSSKSSSGARTTNPSGPRAAAAPAFKPSTVTVSVLNGTSTNQLAHRIGGRLAASGYKDGMIATATNQTEANTVVAYLPGATNRNDALHVASALGLHSSAVRPVDRSTLQVACPVSTSCTSNVVVTVGADLTSP